MVRAGTAVGKAAGIGSAGVADAGVPGSSFASTGASPCTFCADEGGGEECVAGRTGHFFHSVSSAVWKITIIFKKTWK
jgi:hypothetical protein